MSILKELNTLLEPFDIPVETGVFSDTPPDKYIVITPMVDLLEHYADNLPQAEIAEARLSLFNKENYVELKNRLTNLLLAAGFTVTGRRYIGFEEDTKYHHYAIDVMMESEMEVL